MLCHIVFIMRPTMLCATILTLALLLTPTSAQTIGSYYIDRDSCNTAQVSFIRVAINGAFEVSELFANNCINGPQDAVNKK